MLNWLRKKRAKAAARRTAQDLRGQFFDLQKTLQPDAFIEVGAYDGSTSLEMRSVLPDARIVAFEAHPANHAYFASRLRHAQRGVEYLHAAVAEEPGELTFRVQTKHHGRKNKRGSIIKRSASDDMAEAHVPAVSLDGFFRDRMPRKPSLWIDVEGASREVLTGGRALLEKAASVLIEVEDDERWEGQWLAPDVAAFMAVCGLTPIGRDYEYGAQYNVLFRRMDSPPQKQVTEAA